MADSCKMKQWAVRCPAVIQTLDAITTIVVGDSKVCAVELRKVPGTHRWKQRLGALLTKQSVNQLCGVTLCPLLRRTSGRGPDSRRTDSLNIPTPVTPALTKSACSPARSKIGLGN
jgi:hypothetical protein